MTAIRQGQFWRPRTSRLVVVHQGALGDFLLALHAIEGLVEASGLGAGAVRIDFLTKRAHFDLIACRPYAGAFRSCDGPELIPFFHEDLRAAVQAPSIFHDADGVFIFGQNSSRILAEKIGGSLSCPVHWLQSFPRLSNSGRGAEAVEADTLPDRSGGLTAAIHVRDFLKKQLELAGWTVADTTARIRPTPEATEAAVNWIEAKGSFGGRRPVIIHPGSGGIEKIWPLERWWALLCWLRDELDWPVAVTLGPADEHLRSLASTAGTHGIWIAEGISLPMLAALLAESTCYVGNDSGVSHLAAAVGVPSLVIFGPITDPAVWGPLGPQVCIIEDLWDNGGILEWAHTRSCSENLPVEPRVKNWVSLWTAGSESFSR